MNKLLNVYCLGCKMRHPEVEISEVIEMNVKGSIRYQGKGVCENGKTWCKILKKEEIPSEHLNSPPSEDDDSISVFEKGADLSPQETVVEEPVEQVPVVEEPVEQVPVVEELVEQVPVVEEPVEQVPVVEEPVEQVPVVEELLVEAPVRVPEPLSPADIKSFDTPVVAETYEAPQTYYDGINGLEEDEEEEEIRVRVEPERHPKRLRVRRSSPFVPHRGEPYRERKMAEPEPESVPIRQLNEQDDIEKAKKVGDFMGRSMFNAVGDDYIRYVRANWEKTKIPFKHFEYFEASYIAGGTQQVAEKKAEESQMDGKTIAGIAGIGILAAWFASQLANNDSP